ncbi:MAG: SBBP repeat-containing protein, partial [Promethearchaeota archaeon]
MDKKKYSFIIILVILMATFRTLINSSVSDDIIDSKFIKIAATSPVLWNNTWGGSENENAEGIVLDSSGNAYITGKTASFGAAGSADVYLAEFNSNGGFERYFLWGGDAYEGGEAIALDSSGNVYVTGFTYSFEAEGSDIFLVKFHPIYGVEWYYTWGGSEDDVGIAITLDSLGNAYVAGLTSSFGEGNDDVCLVKFNPIGHVEWYYTWGGGGFDRGFAITLDSSGNAYITGETNSFGAGGYDIFLVKFNSTGGVEGNCTWGGIENEAGVSISLDSSGKVYVAGRTESFGAGSKDMCLVKFNSIDGVEWNSTWGGLENDEGFALTLDSSKNAYVTGGTGSFGAGNDDLCLVKFNSIGGVEWNYI